MNLTKMFFIVGLMGLLLLLGANSPALACDPSDCPATPPVFGNNFDVPTPVATLIATGTKSNSDNSASLILPSNPDLVFPLACLLPDGNYSSNALGVVDSCPAMPIQVRSVKAVTTPAPAAPKIVAVAPTAVAPKGDSPGSAKSITDAWLTLEPGAVHWYRIDNGNNFFLDVWLDTHGVSGITLAVYSPEQTNALSIDLPAKGRGSPVKNEPHDLIWKGSYATGVWFALVRNYNSVPVQYKIGTAQSSADRNCWTYQERLPSGDVVMWTDCGHYTTPPQK